MSFKRTVLSKGTPEINEDATASAQVKPGYLVTQSATVAHQAVAGANVPRDVALERDELGTGIDDSLRGDGTPSAYYASGDVVKVARGYAGVEFTMFLASGYVCAVGDRLQTHGDGTLRPLEASQTPLFTAVDAVSAQVAAVTAIRVRCM